MMTSERSKIEARELWRYDRARRLALRHFGKTPGKLSVEQWQRVWRMVAELERIEAGECAE
jgi:hypothetical protein